MMDNQQQGAVTWATLTDREREALKIVHEGGDRERATVEAWNSIYFEGLVYLDTNTDKVKLTDLGRRVLASAEAEKPATITAEGWYYSCIAQWMPEYSTEKINGYDGPFSTWQTALEALFKEVSDDIDSYRADLARMQAALAKAEAENKRLREIIAAYDEYTGGDCPFCEGTGEAAVGFDDNPNVYETIFEECKNCHGSGKVAEALQAAATDDAAAGE